MLDLFGVEVAELPRVPAADSGSTKQNRRDEWLISGEPERDADPDAWLDWRYGEKAAPTPLDDAAAKLRAAILAQTTGDAPLGTVDAELRRLTASYAKSIHLATSAAPVAAQSFPDARTRRQVLNAQLENRARPLVHTQAEFPPLWKEKGIRHLRALVRKHTAKAAPRKSVLRKCGRVRHSAGGVTPFQRTMDDGRPVVSLSGITRCGSVHSCACCAPRIATKRAAAVAHVVAAHRATGGDWLFLTLTFPHEDGMRLRTLRRAKSEAWRLFQQGAPWLRLKAALGFVGSIAAQETTHGGAGWHPHIHALIAIRAPLDADALALVHQRIYERWCEALLRQDVLPLGRPNPGNEEGSGVVLKPLAFGDGSYINKLGLADELVRAIDKEGRGGNRTPWQIMAHHAVNGNSGDRELLREYIRGMKGARQLTWSRGRLLPCPSCASNAALPDAERAKRCPTQGFHGVDDLRRIYPQPTGADAETLALLMGDDSNADALRADDAKGVAGQAFKPGQWDALVRVFSLAGSDAESEVRNALEVYGMDSGRRVVLASASREGERLAARHPKLLTLLDWLKDDDPPPLTG